MKTVLFYLIQVTIASGLLYGYYHFFLRNKRFHQYNRFYLLLASIVSLIVPFLNIPLYFTRAEKDSLIIQTLSSVSFRDTGLTVRAGETISSSSGWFTQHIFLLVYPLIVFLLCIRMLVSLARIRRIKRSNPVEQLDAIQFINTDEPGTPFSFFRWLFWNKNIELQSPKGEQLFRHELFHIEQKHSYDVLYMELLSAICWINPFFYLIRKELKAIHEFLADRFAIRENKKWEYAELLLMQAFGTRQSLVNPFFNTQIKRRIAMITSSTKPSYQYLRKIMVLPMTVLVIFLLACSYKEKNETFLPADAYNSETQANIYMNTKRTYPTEAYLQQLKMQHPLVDTTIKPGQIKIEPYFPGGSLKWNEYLQKNIKSTVAVEKGAPAGSYTVVVQFMIHKDGKMSDIKPLTNHGYGMEQEVVRLISQGPKWNPVMIDGKYRDTYKVQPVTFVVSEDVTSVEPGPVTDMAARFPGGEQKWKEYLDYYFKKYPITDIKLTDGAYTVVVYFLVDENGDISGLKALTNFGHGLEEKAIDLIAKGPKWEPGMMGGRKTKSSIKQKVTFIVGKGEKNFRPVQDPLTGKYPRISIAQLKKTTPQELLQLSAGTEILHYKFTIDVDNGDISETVNKGNEFASVTREQINSATSGRLTTIDMIKVKINGEEKKLPSLIYEVVN